MSAATPRRSAPVSTRARGEVRRLVERLAADAARITAAAEAVPQRLVDDFLNKATTGSQRAGRRIVAALGAPPMWNAPRSLAWRVLGVHPAVPGQEGASADQQPCVVVETLMLGAQGRTRFCREPFGAAFTAHALQRLADRTGFNADLVLTIRDAHDALLAMPPAEGEQLLALGALIVPTASGAFLATTRRVGSDESPLAICRTWVPRGRLHSDQAVNIAAWGQLLESAGVAMSDHAG